MGNNLGGGNGKSAKVMKINGEYFKVKIPAKVIDIIKDYPDHVLLDSQQFLRYNLRAKPLDFEDELKPKKIYLLFSLPKFPDNKNGDEITSSNIVDGGVNVKSPLRRVRSGVSESTGTPKELKVLMSKRSISDLSIRTKSTSDLEDGGSHIGGGNSPVVGPTRLKMRLPKAQVEMIMEESNDDVEVAQRILQLFAVENGGDAVVHVEEDGGGCSEGRENVVVVEEEVEKNMGTTWFNVHGMCSPLGSHQQRKYKKLSV